MRTVMRAAAVGLAVLMPAAATGAAEVDLPSTISTTAYDLGSTGHAQLTGIGSALKNRYNVSLRILPGKNDVARIKPLAEGRVDLAATGSDAVFAQEGLFVFGQKDWGPVPVRMVIMSVTSGGNAIFATQANSGIEKMSDLKGRRVAVIKGGPTSEMLGGALLAFGGLTWDDVVRVEQAGFAAQANALLAGQVDAITTASTTPNNLKQEASPDGLYFIPTPAADKEGWARMQEIMPWMFPNLAMEGPSIPPEGQELAATPYPILLTLDSKDPDFAYNVTKAFVETYDDYKDSAPGAEGWTLERQKFGDAFIPVHEGAVRYYQEIGFWTPEFGERREELLKRQAVVQETWSDYKSANADKGDEEFTKGWMKARADALKAEGFVTIVEQW